MNAIEMKCGGKPDADFLRLRCVLACIGKDPVRLVLNKVLVEEVRGGVTIVASDGARLRRDRFAMRAAPGLYDIRTNTTKAIRLEPCREPLKFPDYKKAIPSCGEKSAYVVSGTGSRFVMWAASALGCCVDPKLMALGDEEKVEVFLQKNKTGMSPVVARNSKSLLVIMPVQLDDGVAEKLGRFQLEQLRRQPRERPVARQKARSHPKPRPWWLPASARHKAA